MKRVLHLSARALKAILTLLLLLIVGLTIFLNSNLFDSIIRKQIETRLSKAMRRDVTVGNVAFNPFRLDVRLANFKIGNDPRSPEVPFFKADQIYAHVSWSHLLGGRIRVTEVRLIRPELHVIFYPEGGNNWPKIERKKTTGEKKRGVQFVLEKVDCEEMMVVYNNRRVPLSFNVKNLKTFVQYDFDQRNYEASTTFENGFLKIMRFEFFQFRLESDYRIIGKKIHFNKLNFLSAKSKFYMKGDMFNPAKPTFDFHFNSEIDLEQTKQMFHFGPEMFGKGTFEADYKGSFTEFEMTGKGGFRDFIFYNLPIQSALFNLNMTDDWLRVADIRARMFDGSYNGTFSIAPLKGRSIFRTTGKWNDWDGRALTRFIRMADIVLPVKASGTASMQWPESGVKDMTGALSLHLEPSAGMQRDLAAEAEATKFDNTLFRNQYVLPLRNDTTLRIAGRQFRDIRSHVETPYTIADVDGTIDFSGKADLNVVSQSAKISEVDLLFHYLQAYFKHQPATTKEFWGVRGAADFSGKLDQTVWSPFKPRITGTVEARDVLYHNVPWTTAHANVMLYDKLIEVYDSTLTLNQAEARATAKFFLGDSRKGTKDRLEVSATVQDYPVNQIPRAFDMDLPVSGSTNATLQLRGTFDDLEGRADFEAFKGSVWGEKWDRATGVVLFRPDSLGIRDITAYMNGGVARASGDLEYEGRKFNVQFSAQNLPLQRLHILQERQIAVTGLANAEGSGSGSFRNPQLTGEIRVKNLTYGKELYGDVESSVSLTRDELLLAASGITRGVPSTVKAEISLNGNLPFRANFDITKFPLELLVRTYAPDAGNVAGLIGGTFNLSGTMRPLDIKNLGGDLNVIELQLYGLKLKQARPLNIRLTEDAIHINDSLLVGDNMRVSLTGRIFPEQKGRLDLEVVADADLALLQQWNKDITAKGPASTKVSVGGTFGQPTLAGILEIRQGFFRHFRLPNSLTDINALVTFKNRNISLQSFKATSSGGNLTAGGSAVLKGYSLDTYRFDVYADDIRVHYPEGLRSTINAELHLQAERDVSYLNGDIVVLQGIYTRSFEAAPNIFGTASVPTFAGLTAGTVGPSRELNLNIRIRSEGNLLVRNNFANIQSSANLSVVGSMDDPVVLGRLEVEKGTVTFRDREFNVQRGSVTFSNPYRTEPLLNFVAETRIREYQITLTFTGTFDRVYHEVQSDPPLPRDDLYALLGIGSTPEEITTYSVPTLLAGEEISRFITGPIASPLEKGFRSVFGLQRFTIDPTFVQSTGVATARITLQKDISRDFTITYSTNLFTAAEEIVLLQYQLTDQIQITASKDERARYGIDILVTKTFE